MADGSAGGFIPGVEVKRRSRSSFFEHFSKFSQGFLSVVALIFRVGGELLRGEGCLKRRSRSFFFIID